MKTEEKEFFKNNPEGAVIVALDSREDGFLFGAVELRGGTETWLDYELESNLKSDLDGDLVSLYRETENEPVFAYRARRQRVDTVTLPDQLLVLWNRGRCALAVDGRPLHPGTVCSIVSKGVYPWLLRFANWLPGRE